MKVNLVGSQGSGKSSTVEAFMKRRNSSWTHVGSVARPAKSAGLGINDKADPLSQLLITCRKMTLELDVVTPNMISDRSIIDSLAYTNYQLENVWSNAPEMYREVSESLVKNHLEKIDYIFYCPPFWLPKNDGIRSTDAGYQLVIDRLMLELLDEHQVNYITMPQDHTNRRVEFIEDHLGLTS